MTWVAIDAMGGDDAPRVVVDGALAAARHLDLGVALVGPRAVVAAELERHQDADASRVRVVDAPDVIGMTESPAAALRRKPRASIGEEETKGNELTRDAHRLLKDAPLAFVGNIEARRVYSGDADVIVCDGFTGNVVLKTGEGLVEMIESELSSTFTLRVRSLLS